MADKKCPNCGLWNSGSAILCDCGYDFEKHTIQPVRHNSDHETTPEPVSPKDWLTITSFITSTIFGILSVVLPITYLFFYLFMLPSIYESITNSDFDQIMCSPFVRWLGAIIGLLFGLIGIFISTLTIVRLRKSHMEYGYAIMGLALCVVGIIMSLLFGLLVDFFLFWSDLCM